MAGYLDQYGVAEARREGVVKRIVLAGLAIVVLVGAYFLFPDLTRTWSEKRTLNGFLAKLEQKDYQGAYRMWGYNPAAPDKFYDLEKFNEDWGPKSTHASAQAAKVDNVDFCDAGVVFDVSFPGTEPVALYVERSTNVISFAPWPECPGRHWEFRRFFKNIFSS